MNLNFLKIFVKNLKKHRLISAINLIGLTIGILSRYLGSAEKLRPRFREETG